MDILRLLKVHLIGIAGTGMGALARLLREAGHEVRGSDEGLYPPMSTQLAAAEIPVATGFAARNLEWGPDRVVVGNRCGRDHPEVVAARELELPLESFPSMLAKHLFEGREPLVVAGTHGKTTTTALLAWLLRVAGRDPSFLVGGVPLNLGVGSHLGGGSAFVIEGDEYDTAFFDKGPKFLHYRARRAILTSVEFDHADIFADIEEVRGAFRSFVETIPESGELCVHIDDSEAMGVAASARCRVITYRVLAKGHDDVGSADYCARVTSRGGARRTVFEVFERGESLGEFSTQLIGRFNLVNVMAALSLARLEGVEPAALRRAVRRFRGVRRRQELLGVAQGVRLLEDFAHHPTAVALAVQAMRRRYSEKALHVCFEPRSSSSRRNVFFDAYAKAFDAGSNVYIAPVFRPDKVPAGELLDTEALARTIAERGVTVRAFAEIDALAEAVMQQAVPGDTVLLLSSGDFGGLAHKLLFGIGDPVMFATDDDAGPIDELLKGYGLPTVEPADTVETLVIRAPEGVVGCVSVEVQGDSAFLFGLAVSPERRGGGLGWVLGDCVLRRARTLGARVVYLTTGTATDFFATKLGFRPIEAERVEQAVRQSPNFSASAALPNAVCMVCELPPEPGAGS